MSESITPDTVRTSLQSLNERVSHLERELETVKRYYGQSLEYADFLKREQRKAEQVAIEASGRAEKAERERDILAGQVTKLREAASKVIPIELPEESKEERVDPLYGPLPKYIPSSLVVSSEAVMELYAALSSSSAAEAYRKRVQAEVLEEVRQKIRMGHVWFEFDQMLTEKIAELREDR